MNEINNETSLRVFLPFSFKVKSCTGFSEGIFPFGMTLLFR